MSRRIYQQLKQVEEFMMVAKLRTLFDMTIIFCSVSSASAFNQCSYMPLSDRETGSSPHPPSSLGVRTSASLWLSSVSCTPSVLPLFAQSRKKKQNSFPADFFFWQILAGGKICPSILN